VVGIAKYLAGRIHKARQSGAQLQLDITLVKLPDGTFLRSVGPDTEAVSKSIYAGLATITSDPEARALLLRLAAGADPSTELTTSESQATGAGAEGGAGDQHDTDEPR
jgi:hypothetical protein